MKENIEIKDVQRTEYLDKNGLDMLWAKVKENTHNQVEVERNRAVAKENSIIDTKADKSALDNYVLTTALAEYAKKTDIPEVDTSDFISKTTTDAQVINSTLGIIGGGIQMIDYIADSDPVSLELSSSALAFDGCDRSTITLNASDVNSNNGSRIIIEAYNENPQITLQSNVGSDFAFHNNLTITNEGISNTDNNANHVYATDGSIADLTQYALSSTIAALQQKITDNTTAISAKQDAGNYIPYESIANNGNINYKTYVMKHNEGILFDSSSGDVSIQNGEIIVKSDVRKICVAPSFIWLQEISDNRETLLFELDENGLRLRNGDNNHVLTSYGSTIDITQYALKSQLPTVPTKVSQLQNDSNFAYKEVVDELFAQLKNQIGPVSNEKQNKIIPGNIDISAANFQNTIVSLKETIMSLITTLEKSGLITVTRS